MSLLDAGKIERELGWRPQVTLGRASGAPPLGLPAVSRTRYENEKVVLMKYYEIRDPIFGFITINEVYKMKLNIPWHQYALIVLLTEKMQENRQRFGKTALQKLIYAANSI